MIACLNWLRAFFPSSQQTVEERHTQSILDAIGGSHLPQKGDLHSKRAQSEPGDNLLPSITDWIPALAGMTKIHLFKVSIANTDYTGTMGDFSSKEIKDYLEQRIGNTHAKHRLGMENYHHQEVFTANGKFFHLENWYSIHSLIRRILQISGLYALGERNALDIQLRHNRLQLANLPPAFDGFTILHLSDLHLDMHPRTAHQLIDRIRQLDYDIVVMTGDYRAKTYGEINGVMPLLRNVRNHLSGEVYAVLGNHDSIAMVPEMEAMDITLLLNESRPIARNGQSIFISGIDDAHYFRADNIEKSLADVPEKALKILLSHTPEIFRQAAYCGFDVFFCGHTHGGQICLPGGIPLTLDSSCPRSIGKGAWQFRQMRGYTSAGSGASIVNVRLNCLPEVTLHTLQQAATSDSAGESPN
jgi:predicted MPP superfamily phosphohydrolase